MIAESTARFLPSTMVRPLSVPRYRRWIQSEPELTHLDKRNRKHLYHLIKTHDATLLRIKEREGEERGVLHRFCKVPMVDVFYQSGDTTYRLQETRTTVKRHRNAKLALRKVKRGDRSSVTDATTRKNSHSISERGKLDGETPADGKVRAVEEEMFNAQLGIRGRRRQPHLRETIRSLLIPKDPPMKVFKRSADDKNNTIQGLPALYFLFPTSFTVTPETPVPIDLKGGIPQPLYEIEKGRKRTYINIFEWVQVPKETVA